MIKKLIIIMISSLFIGCMTTSSIKDTYYKNRYIDYEWDHWDYYVDAIKSGRLIFEWPVAVFVYLISNVEILDSRPEEIELDYWMKLSIVFNIFRIRW